MTSNFWNRSWSVLQIILWTKCLYLYVVLPTKINKYSNKMINRAAVDGTLSQIPAFYLWPLPWCQGHTKCCPIPSTSCHLYMHHSKFEVTTHNCLWNAFTRKYIIWPWPCDQGRIKCCQVPSTLCDLCTSEVCSCNVYQFRRKCIYKKIHYMTLT